MNPGQWRLFQRADKGLRQEMRDLKELVAELSLENRLLKKNMLGHGGGEE